MPNSILYENVDMGGRRFVVRDGENIPVIRPPLDGSASSLETWGAGWVTFWESINFDAKDDQLWIEDPANGDGWYIPNLHKLPRPHGNNHWGDRIRGVSHSGAPTGSNENRTIIHANRTVTVGNRHFTASEKEYSELGLEVLSLEGGKT
ncbi:MAG: hypothetical protein ACREDR_31800, partial [Blastocatellia bacterium]